MKSSLAAFLDNFSILTPVERALIVDRSNVQEFKRGDVLLREGEVADRCFLVLQGCVREFFMKDGDEKTVAFYTEYEPVNSFTSTSTGQPSTTSFICAEDCVLTVGHQSLEAEMCALIPRLESVIRTEVERETAKAREELTRFVSSSAEERYEYLIKARLGLMNRVPQHQIASYLGVTAETLSRIRKRLLKKA